MAGKIKRRKKAMPSLVGVNMKQIPNPLVILCGDFSLNRPGIAVLEYNTETGIVTTIYHEAIEHKRGATTGQKLFAFGEWLKMVIMANKPHVLVRERMFSRFPSETQQLAKVIGQSDLAAFTTAAICNHGETAITRKIPEEFFEIPPVSIKKIVTGDGKASKEQVAEAVREYVGDMEFAFDDESDAIAAGIAWIILNEYPLHKLKDLEEKENQDGSNQ